MSLPTYEEALHYWREFERYLVETRYSIRDENGVPLEHSYDDIINRVANWITSKDTIEKLPESLQPFVNDRLQDIKTALLNKYIILATPVLMNGGSRSRRLGYFSCFPLGYVEDSIDDIMKKAKLMADIYLKGGGAGINISKLRSKGSLVDNHQGFASGPVSFLQIFDSIAGTISQGGRRRGALMVDCSENNLDWEDFINCKSRNKQTLQNMNISLDIEDDLSENVINKVAKSIWECGDPGLIFIRNAYNNTPIPRELDPRHVNPCSEYMSVAMTACNLLSVNVTKLAKISNSILHLMELIDNASYLSCIIGTILIYQEEGYPDETIKSNNLQYRPVGIGMLGLHGAMIRSNIEYNSESGLLFAEQVQAEIVLGSMIVLVRMIDFDLRLVLCRLDWMILYVDYCTSKLHPGRQYRNIDSIYDALSKYGSLYNIVTTVQAPTGSTSQLVHSASNGIEPLYALEVNRKVVDLNKGLVDYKIIPLELYDENNKLIDTDWIEGTLAHTMGANYQMKMISRIQKLCHTSISKTINIPNESTVDEVKDIINKAFNKYELKCITIYREDSKDIQILNKTIKNLPIIELDDDGSFPCKRSGDTYTINGPRDCHIIVNQVQGVVREVFIESGKSGTILNALLDALGRVISIALRKNPILLKRIADTLRGIDSGTMYFYEGTGARFASIPDALAGILHTEYLGENSPVTDTEELPVPIVDSSSRLNICPVCGNLSLKREGSCFKCQVCPYSSC